MKTNLFISSNLLTTAISAIIVRENYTNDKNILLIVTNHVESKFLESMTNIAKKLNCFSDIVLFNEFSPNSKLNSNVSLKQMKEFDYKKFETKVGVSKFDSIYTTNFYIHSKLIIEHYSDASVNLVENGTASYLYSAIPEQILAKTENIYSFNYFDLFNPQLPDKYKNIKNIVVDKQKAYEIFTELSELVSIDEEDNCVIFLAHNMSMVPNFLTLEQEFDEYARVIKDLTDKGYTVYFKDHPKTSDFFYEKLKSLKLSNVKRLKSSEPLELIIPKLKPKAVVSLFSSTLLTAPHFFDIPAYTFEFKHDLSKMSPYKLGYAMVMSYIPTLNSDKSIPIYPFTLDEHPLFQVTSISALQKFIDRKKFNKIQQNIQNIEYEIFEHFQISKDLYEIFKDGSYWNYLNYFAEPFVKNIKQEYNNSTRFQFFCKAIKTFRKFFD